MKEANDPEHKQQRKLLVSGRVIEKDNKVQKFRP